MSNSVPKNVAAQAAEADAMLAKLAAGENPEEVLSDKPVEKPKLETPVPPAEPVKVPEAAPVTPLVAKNELELKMEELAEKLEREVQTRLREEGRYKKEVEDLKEQVAQRDELIENMEALPHEEVRIADLYTEEERELLDPDYMKMVEKGGNAIVKDAILQNDVKWQKKFDAIVGALDELKNNTHVALNATFADRVTGRLGVNMAQLEQMDASPEFSAFIAQHDGYSGSTIGDSLERMVVSQNLEGAVAIYKDFMDKQGTAADEVIVPSVIPDRLAGAAPSPKNETINNDLTHDDVARMFSSNKINHTQMDELMKQLDKKAEAFYQSGK